jgi:transposase InsO family protein
MKKKCSTTQMLKDLVAEIELQHNMTPKSFPTDNGSEYISNELKDHLRQKGIVHQYTTPYSPESNCVAERLNRTIGESLRAMLESTPIYDKRHWAEADSTSVYLKNRQPHTAVKVQTPYDEFHCSKSSITHHKSFGSEYYIHIPKQRQLAGMKLQPWAQRAILTGYTNDDHHYRVHLPESKHTLVTNDIFFPPSKTEGESKDDKSSYNK